MRNDPNIPFSLLRFQKTFEGDVCKLVDDAKTLGLIGEEKGERLTPAILSQWIARAKEAFVLVVDSEVVGFGTIGFNEWAFPQGYCEVGHLIIKSGFRRRGYGSILLLCLLDEIRKREFTCAVSRVCVGNDPARRLFQKQGWQSATFIHDHRFEWFYRECQLKKEQNSLLY